MMIKTGWGIALALCGATAMGCAVDSSGTGNVAEQTASENEALTGPGGCTVTSSAKFEQSVADIVIKDLLGGNHNNIPQDGSYCNSGPEQYLNNLTQVMTDIEAKLNAGTATITGVGPGWVTSGSSRQYCVPANFYKIAITDGSIPPGYSTPGGNSWMQLLANSIAHCEMYAGLGGAAHLDNLAMTYIDAWGWWINNDGSAFQYNTTDGYFDPGPAALTANLSGGNGAAAAATDQATSTAVTAYLQQASYASNGSLYVGGEPCSTLSQVTGYVTSGNIQKQGSYAKCVCAVSGC